MLSSINTNKFRDKLIADQEKKANKSKGGKKDSRILNYFDLDFGQEMTIRFLPATDDGDPYLDYTIHSPGAKEAGRIACSYVSSGEKCPACKRSWEAHESGDKETNNTWIKQNRTLAQCIVIDTPEGFELTLPEEGEVENLVKLVYLPFGIKEAIDESIMNGTVTDIAGTNFVIKKTKNQGGRAAYGKSYFKINDDAEIPSKVMESLQNGDSSMYNIREEIPVPSTAVEVAEWMEKVDEELAAVATTPTTNDGGSAKAAIEAMSKTPETTPESTNDGGTSSSDLLNLLNKRNNG